VVHQRHTGDRLASRTDVQGFRPKETQ
jgi:hypothetical protein